MGSLARRQTIWIIHIYKKLQPFKSPDRLVGIATGFELQGRSSTPVVARYFYLFLQRPDSLNGTQVLKTIIKPYYKTIHQAHVL
jgi:hypothetical protein